MPRSTKGASIISFLRNETSPWLPSRRSARSSALGCLTRRLPRTSRRWRGSPASSPSPPPVTPMRLLGREGELDAIQHMLLCPEVRLLTLTGAAGVGKTRLALAAGQQMADTFPQAVSFVDLAPVRDAHLVLPTLARQLGVQDVGSDLLLNQLRAFLQDRRAQLILDNFEQVLPAAAQMADLLATCPGIKL